MKERQTKKILLCAALVVLAAQLKVNLFDSSLIISVAIVLFPCFAMIWGEYPALPVAALAAVGNFAFRVILGWLDTGSFPGGSYWPEVVFYLAYGVMFFCYFRHIRWSVDRWQQLLPLALFDYAANLAELVCRGSGLDQARMHLGLVVVAVLRTALVWVFWSMLKHQNLSLLKREHAERYRHLMLLLSKLRGEMIWMQKSEAMMEQAMSTAYQLYTRLQAEGNPACTQALSISKDVHEIKKEYQMIVRGMSEALEEDLEEDQTSFRQLWQVLFDHMKLSARHAGVEVDWEVDLSIDFQTNKPYQLLSILRNLMDNAIEAAADGKVRIAFRAFRDGGGKNDVFTVTNWGKPIPPRCLPHIFDPGFSTKVNYATGQVGRGVGLCLVRDLTEQELGGSVSVDAQNDMTAFTVSIPITALEVSGCDSI